LHFVTVPGTKSFLQFVRHLDEQLLMAICLESESKAVARPIVDATMQVMSMYRILIALRRLLAWNDFLLAEGE
jgi:hypothetical protein